MTITTGSIVHPEGPHSITASSTEELDAAVEVLRANKGSWAATSIERRIAYLEGIMERTAAVAEKWVRAACSAKGISFDAPVAAEEWHGGPVLLIRNARLLKDALADVARHGSPQYPGPVTTRKGQTIVKVFPTDIYDRLLWTGLTGEIWMEPGVSPAQLASTQAVIYQPDQDASCDVALVLGAGNVACIPAMDSMYKLFVENNVVALKMNPVNEYLGPILTEAFSELIEAGFLRILYGGANEGYYLCHHEGIGKVHITGSDKTHDSIVFGMGEEGKRRKAANDPHLGKPIASELGNVTPVIVVPGPWSDSDVAYQGKNIASMLTHNAGFNCIAARVVVTPESWSLREPLLAAIRDGLDATPDRPAYYPGAEDRWKLFVDEHPEAGRYGEAVAGTVPWTFIEGLRADNEADVCFTTEAFTGLFGEAPLPSSGSDIEFLERAVEFCNEKLWGQLGATLIIHPKTLKQPGFAAALEEAIGNLRYGTVAVNIWVGLGYALTSTSWGAFPGNTMENIGSGIGVVHNTYLFDRVEKSVVRALFKQPVKPLWFPDHKRANDVTRRLVDMEMRPSPSKLPGIFWSALRG